MAGLLVAHQDLQPLHSSSSSSFNSLFTTAQEPKRFMEAHPGATATAAVAVAAEIRKIHIIYFLSRKGRTEHPHLFRVHHFSRHGVRLRDVKRWLGELRGNELPESFAWSYKRKYKTGYVWQDLLDDDLLTPISDNEFVLKGSEITTSFSPNNEQPCGEKVVPMQKDPPLQEPKFSKSPPKQQTHQTPKHEEESRTTSSEIIEEEEDSPTFGSDTSTVTEDSAAPRLEEESEMTEKPNSLRNLLAKKKLRSQDGGGDEEDSGTPPHSTSNSPNSSTFGKSRSIFRNFITCRTVDANDTAVLPVSRRRPSFSTPADDKNTKISAELCKPEKLGGSQRIYGTNRNQEHHQNKPRKSWDGVNSGSRRSFSGAYKSPNCSQCGKPFNPEKLHSHMKSCKGMKVWAKSSNPVSIATPKDSDTPTKQSSMKNSVSDYYLTS